MRRYVRASLADERLAWFCSVAKRRNRRGELLLRTAAPGSADGARLGRRHLRWAGVFNRVAFHQRLQIYHSERTVLWIIPEFGGAPVLFENALEDHTVQWSVTHMLLVLNQIGLRVRDEVDSLPAGESVLID